MAMTAARLLAGVMLCAGWLGVSAADGPSSPSGTATVTREDISRAMSGARTIFSRFVQDRHLALFQEPLLDPVYFLVAYAVCLGLGALGWRHMRAAQMVRQYSWAYARSGPFGWAEKSGV